MSLNGFDVRFSYNSDYIQPSSLITNEITSDQTAFFEFEDEFADSLSFLTLPFDAEGSGMRATISFNPPVSESEHIIGKEDIGKVVNTDGGVLLR